MTTHMTTIEIRIVYDAATGNIQVHGPVQNPLLMLGLLEMAKGGLRLQGRPEPPPKIVVPQPLVPS